MILGIMYQKLQLQFSHSRRPRMYQSLALKLRNGVAMLPGRIEPQSNGFTGTGQGLLLAVPVSQAAWQFRTSAMQTCSTLEVLVQFETKLIKAANAWIGMIPEALRETLGDPVNLACERACLTRLSNSLNVGADLFRNHDLAFRGHPCSCNS